MSVLRKAKKYSLYTIGLVATLVLAYVHADDSHEISKKINLPTASADYTRSGDDRNIGDGPSDVSDGGGGGGAGGHGTGDDAGGTGASGADDSDRD